MSAPPPSWIVRGLRAPIRWYRRWLSPLKRTPSCRYLPTCSEYALEALEARGALVGSALAVGRVLRCNPLFEGGYHPVVVAASAGVRRRDQRFEATSACGCVAVKENA